MSATRLPESSAGAHAADEYLALLGRLAVDNLPESHGGYDRDLFAGWLDADGDGCSTRAEVLLSQSLSATTQHGRCTIDTGSWRSLYDGLMLSDASDVDIDHVVPLSEAWKSGAWQWTPDTRARFANDLGFEGSLIAVSDRSNRAKSDSDPASWMPIPSAACDYAQRWVAVKYRWSLTVDSLERASLVATLTGCTTLLWPIPPPATVTLGSP